jgi:hypothetical protein
VLEFILAARRDKKLELIPQNAVQAKLITFSREIELKASALMGTLSSDELMLLEFRRHAESHPFLDSYFLHLRDGTPPRIRRERVSLFAGRKIPLLELRDSTKRATAGRAMEAVATDYASRTHDAARAYHLALTQSHDIFAEFPK